MTSRLNPLIEEIFLPAARLCRPLTGWGGSLSLFRNLVFVAMFCLLNESLAVEPSLGRSFYATHYWLREDGLPQNTVTAVVQTRDGFIWISTYSGLARFDGVRFTEFDSSTPGLASGRVTSLFESDDGAL